MDWIAIARQLTSIVVVIISESHELVTQTRRRGRKPRKILKFQPSSSFLPLGGGEELEENPPVSLSSCP